MTYDECNSEALILKQILSYCHNTKEKDMSKAQLEIIKGVRNRYIELHKIKMEIVIKQMK